MKSAFDFYSATSLKQHDSVSRHVAPLEHDHDGPFVELNQTVLSQAN